MIAEFWQEQLQITKIINDQYTCISFAKNSQNNSLKAPRGYLIKKIKMLPSHKSDMCTLLLIVIQFVDCYTIVVIHCCLLHYNCYTLLLIVTL